MQPTVSRLQYGENNNWRWSSPYGVKRRMFVNNIAFYLIMGIIFKLGACPQLYLQEKRHFENVLYDKWLPVG